MGGLFRSRSSPQPAPYIPPPPIPNLPPLPLWPADPQLPEAQQLPPLLELPQPPSEQDMIDVFDRVAGVQSIIVDGPDGRKRREVVRLPRTQEEERFYNEGTRLIENSINNIRSLQELASTSPDEIAPIQPFIDVIANLSDERQRNLRDIGNFGDIDRSVNEYKTMNRALLDRQFELQRRRSEESLAHRGLGDSTAAAEYRASLAKEKSLAHLQNQMNADMYGRNLASQRLEQNTRLFDLNEQGRQGQFQDAQARYQLQQQELADREAIRQRREVDRQRQIEDNYRLFGVGASLRGEDMNRALSSHAPEIANQTFSMLSADRLNRANLDLNRYATQEGVALNRYGAESDSDLNRYIAQANTDLNRYTTRANIDLSRHATQNNLNLQQYNSAVTAQNMNFNQRLASFNAQPPSFGDRLLQLGATAAGYYFGGPAGAAAGSSLTRRN